MPGLKFAHKQVWCLIFAPQAIPLGAQTKENTMASGKIKKLVSDKGFGFIQTGGEDVFFHRSSVEGTTFEELQEGQAVEFNIGQGPKGARAENVRLS